MCVEHSAASNQQPLMSGFEVDALWPLLNHSKWEALALGAIVASLLSFLAVSMRKRNAPKKVEAAPTQRKVGFKRAMETPGSQLLSS